MKPGSCPFCYMGVLSISFYIELLFLFFYTVQSILIMLQIKM